MTIKNNNGTLVSDGDSVQVIEKLKVNGALVTLKPGVVINNMRFMDDEEVILKKVS